jgi:hypothetical protein
MTHARTTLHHFMRHLHRRDWLPDTRDPEYAVGRLIARWQPPGRGRP